MKYMFSQLMALMNQSRQSNNLRLLIRFVIILAGMFVVYSVLFHVIMEMEGQRHSWLTGLYWTLTVMSTPKSEPQPKSKSNSYAYTNTKSTNSYSYDPWKSQAKQSTNSQQRESSDSGSSYRYSDGWGQYYTSPEANTIPKTKRKISTGIISMLEHKE